MYIFCRKRIRNYFPRLYEVYLVFCISEKFLKNSKNSYSGFFTVNLIGLLLDRVHVRIFSIKILFTRSLSKFFVHIVYVNSQLVKMKTSVANLNTEKLYYLQNTAI